MNEQGPVLLSVEGAVASPAQFRYSDLAGLPAAEQVTDARTLGSKREGAAVRLEALLSQVAPLPQADYLGLHAEADNFHASIPLQAVRDRAVLIYSLNGRPLLDSAGGPVRLYIPDHAACHADEVDECANVKFIDRIELTVGKGF